MDTFVIKTFGVVDNPNLPKIGEFKFPINDVWSGSVDTKKALELRFSEESAIRTSAADMYTGSGGSTNIGRSATITANALNYFWFAQGSEGYVFIDKYNKLTRMDNSDRGVLKLKLRQFSDCAAMNYLNGGGSAAGEDACTGSIEDLPNAENWQNLGLYGRKVTGDLSHFANNTAMQNIRLWETGVTGSMMNFQHALGLTRFSSTSEGVVFAGNDLCDAMYANGRHSGTLRIEVLGHGDYTVTFTANGWSVNQ